jgi:hypothetical protein
MLKKYDSALSEGFKLSEGFRDLSLARGGGKCCQAFLDEEGFLQAKGIKKYEDGLMEQGPLPVCGLL